MSGVGPGTYENELEALRNAPPGEAVENLDRVLGYVHALENGGEGIATPLGVVLGYLNAVGLMLGSIIITYVVITSIITTAAEGKVLGRRWSSITLPLAGFISLGAIFPTNLGGGYISVAQALVTHVLVAGSNGADHVWRASVDVALVRPVVMLPSVEGRQTARTVLRSLVCEYFIASHDNKEPVVAEYIKRTSRGIQIGDNAQCGGVDLPVYDERFGWFSGADDVLLARAKNAALEAATNETFALVDALRPIAALITDPSSHGLDSRILEDGADTATERNENEKLEQWYRRFEMLADEYSARVHSAIYEAYVSENSGAAAELKEYLKSLGWWRAGASFWKLSAYQRDAANLVGILQQGVSYSEPTKKWGETSRSLMNQRLHVADTFTSRALRGKQSDPIDFVRESGRIADLDVSSICNSDICNAQSMFKRLGTWMATVVIASDRNADLVSWISGMGNRLQAAGVTLWLAELGVTTAEGAAQGVSDSLIGKAGAALATSPLVKILAFAAKALSDFRWIAVVAGTMMSVVVAVPAVLWSVAVLGWFVQAIQIIAATSLAMVLRFDPDDPRFLGGVSNRWYMNILAVSVRPILMIAAFWLSVALSYIAYPLIAENVMMATASSMGNPLSVLGVILLIALALTSFALYIFGLPLSFPAAVAEMYAPGSAGDSGGVNISDTLSVSDKSQTAIKEGSRNLVSGGGGGGPRPPSGGMA